MFPCFDEDYIKIYSMQTKLIPTGIASAFSKDYVGIIKERGSTGVKGIKVSAGIIDSGFRNEIFIAIYNGNDRTIRISKEKILRYDEIYYPYNKAIAQLLMIPVPKFEIIELPYNKLLEIESKRKLNMLGSTNK